MVPSSPLFCCSCLDCNPSHSSQGRWTLGLCFCLVVGSSWRIWGNSAQKVWIKPVSLGQPLNCWVNGPAKDNSIVHQITLHWWVFLLVSQPWSSDFTVIVPSTWWRELCGIKMCTVKSLGLRACPGLSGTTQNTTPVLQLLALCRWCHIVSTLDVSYYDPFCFNKIILRHFDVIFFARKPCCLFSSKPFSDLTLCSWHAGCIQWSET